MLIIHSTKVGINMPHVVLNGKTSIGEIFERFEPLFIRREGTILKTVDSYINREKNAILIDSLVVMPGGNTVFLAYISGRGDGVVVRLFPKMDVEKTEYVKRTLVELAKQLLTKFPDLKVGDTNLGDYF